MVDFIKAEHQGVLKRKVIAQELTDLDGLRRYYRDLHREGVSASLLRLFHVQNATWATRFLLRKFNIDNRDDLVGTDFGNYVRQTTPQRRTGRLLLNGRTWRVQHDPWRGVSKTSFGLDYLKAHRVLDPQSSREQPELDKMMELNCLDEQSNPTYGYDVYRQGLACYIQHKESSAAPPTGDAADGTPSPYDVAENGFSWARKHNEYIPMLSSLDNNNAIIVFDNSQTGSFEDCLISARGELETHWRRLPFYREFPSNFEHVPTDQLKLDEQLLIISLWRTPQPMSSLASNVQSSS